MLTASIRMLTSALRIEQRRFVFGRQFCDAGGKTLSTHGAAAVDIEALVGEWISYKQDYN